MPGHRVHAEQVAGRDHIGAPRPQRGAGALPGVAAVEQQRAPRARLGAQAPHQRRQVREAAHPAVALGQRREIAVRERVRLAAAGRDAEALEERRADQVRRAAARRAEAEVGVRLAKVQRQQLRVAVGEVQQPQFAERRQRIGIFARGARGQQPRRSRGRQHGQEFAPAQGLHGGATACRVRARPCRPARSSARSRAGPDARPSSPARPPRRSRRPRPGPWLP